MNLFRIWIPEKKMMATCADYMVASNGEVYEMVEAYLPEDGPYLYKVDGACVMLNSQYMWDMVNQKYLYEGDIVMWNGMIGIVYHNVEDPHFPHWSVEFVLEEESEMLLEVRPKLVTDYFRAPKTAKWRRFKAAVPDYMRPDRGRE